MEEKKAREGEEKKKGEGFVRLCECFMPKEVEERQAMNKKEAIYLRVASSLTPVSWDLEPVVGVSRSDSRKKGKKISGLEKEDR